MAVVNFFTESPETEKNLDSDFVLVLSAAVLVLVLGHWLKSSCEDEDEMRAERF